MGAKGKVRRLGQGAKGNVRRKQQKPPRAKEKTPCREQGATVNFALSLDFSSEKQGYNTREIELKEKKKNLRANKKFDSKKVRNIIITAYLLMMGNIVKTANVKLGIGILKNTKTSTNGNTGVFGQYYRKTDINTKTPNQVSIFAIPF